MAAHAPRPPATQLGLSIRPPPATTPTVARHSSMMEIFLPLGSLMRVTPSSTL